MDADWEQLLQSFNITVAQWAGVSAATMTVVQFLKTKITWFEGYRTDILAFTTAVVFAVIQLGMPANPTDWIRVIVLGAACWASAAGAKKVIRSN